MPRLRKFGANTALRRSRNARGFSQAQLARAAGLSQSVVAKLETGVAQTTARLATVLSRPLGVDPRELFPSALIEPSGTPSGDVVDMSAMRRAMTAARRLAADDDTLAAEIGGAIYELLVSEARGYPISDNERTLDIIERLIARLIERARPTSGA